MGQPLVWQLVIFPHNHNSYLFFNSENEKKNSSFQIKFSPLIDEYWNERTEDRPPPTIHVRSLLFVSLLCSLCNIILVNILSTIVNKYIPDIHLITEGWILIILNMHKAIAFWLLILKLVNKFMKIFWSVNETKRPNEPIS